MKNEDIRKAFLTSTGSLIARKRKHKNITQGELGKELDVSASTISKYEHGSMEIPLSSLPLISSYCSFPMREYVTEWENFDVFKFVTELLTAKNTFPDKYIINEYIESCSENDIQDLKLLGQVMDVITNEQIKEVISELIIKIHIKQIKDDNKDVNKFKRLLAYCKYVCKSNTNKDDEINNNLDY